MATNLTTLFTNIANAIRVKTGGTEQIVAENFPTAITEMWGKSGTLRMAGNTVTDSRLITTANQYRLLLALYGELTSGIDAVIVLYLIKNKAEPSVVVSTCTTYKNGVFGHVGATFGATFDPSTGTITLPDNWKFGNEYSFLMT